MLARWWRGTRARPMRRGSAPVDATDAGSGRDDGVGPRRRHRLRHQLHPPARRRRRRRRPADRPRPPDEDRPARPGRRPHRAARPRGAGAHLRACAEYAAQCRELGAERVRFVATSASRDAENRDEFVAGVRDAFGNLGVEPEVVTGDEEARFSFTGATGDLPAVGVPGPYLVVDIGGGSTEFVVGDDHVEAARSVDVGCVRMTERHLHADPPTADQIAAARRGHRRRARRGRGDRRPRRHRRARRPGRHRHHGHRARPGPAARTTRSAIHLARGSRPTGTARPASRCSR